MLTAGQLEAIGGECARVLAQNWRAGERHSDGLPFHDTCPSPGRYPWQWYWGSGFAAIAGRRFDRVRAELELRSLLAAQREDGFIGHTIFWNEPLSGWRRFTYNVTPADATMTASIQPPLLAWAWRRIAVAGGPVCCEVTTNVLYNLSRLAMGQPSLTPALITRTYDEPAGLFLPVARPQPPRRPAATIAALTPLALPDLPEAIGHRLVRVHLLDPTRFWTAVPPPSVSASDPSFSARDTGRIRRRRYWRGPTWVNTAWLCWLGLVRLGSDEAAAQLAERVAGAIAAAGLREYYHPAAGAGMGARDFAWSALVLEMTDGDRHSARSSFLKR